MEYTYSGHAETAQKERRISDELIESCLEEPDCVERKCYGTIHYCKRFERLSGRWLRVVVNEYPVPPVIVTVFFDRRLRRVYDDKN